MTIIYAKICLEYCS